MRPLPLLLLIPASSTTELGAGASPADARRPSFLFILADDIGWGDLGYSNGTALTPHISAWAKRSGSIVMQDFHSGGTVCSPTRATVLTGRNHYRDCVEYVYDCSDPLECTPQMNFAPRRTFTIADAARAAKADMASMFFGKWHLGSFFNDSEARGGITSNPITHGFDRMNATLEVAPTATTNCMCRSEWSEQCDFGHYKVPAHCTGSQPPGEPSLPPGCCFNYWREDSSAATGVSNMTTPVGGDDAEIIAEAFENFLIERRSRPFLAQLSFHNCHIPFIGTHQAREACRSGETCRAHDGHGRASANFSDSQLDYFACLNELDAGVGKALASLERHGYYDNTMVWFTTDNGPEGNCGPSGYCNDRHYLQWPGSSGPLRGRKRDIWEGGHRVPGVISWPAVVKGPARESWDLVVTMDFFATVMDVLQVSRSPEQLDWPVDGLSIMPILRGESWPERGMGWMYETWSHSSPNGYRYGQWKYVNGSTSCKVKACNKEQLFDLSADLSEATDVSSQYPQILSAIRANFSEWWDSISFSRDHQSRCHDSAAVVSARSSSRAGAGADGDVACDWRPDSESVGPELGAAVRVQSKEECLQRCLATSTCAAADARSRPSGVPRRTGVFSEEDLRSEDGLLCQMRRRPQAEAASVLLRSRPGVAACVLSEPERPSYVV